MSLKSWKEQITEDLLWLSDPQKWANRFDEHIARRIFYARQKSRRKDSNQTYLTGIVKGARDIWREERAKNGHNRG